MLNDAPFPQGLNKPCPSLETVPGNLVPEPRRPQRYFEAVINNAFPLSTACPRFVPWLRKNTIFKRSIKK